jgi:tetraacyldisaccharide 4'-kinase
MSWGNPQTETEHLLTGLLSPFASLYGLGNRLHKWTYASGLQKSLRLPVPVISVGNLSCGGTGKTPIVIELAQRLIEQGLKVGILSRGYARRERSNLVIVSNGERIMAAVHQSGDEPLVMAEQVPKAVVISSSNRYEAGLRAVADYRCEVLILDDGFQHYRLDRDLDLVLIDYESDPLNDALLPAGRLREAPAALARASQVIITKVPEPFDAQKINNLEFLVRRYSPLAGITMCRFVPRQIKGFSDGKPKTLPVSFLSGLKVITFCGLAQPENFASQVSKLGANVVDSYMFPDHHWYSAQELDTLASKLKQASGDFLVTTKKDLVKLQTSSVKTKILAVELETQWIGEFPSKVITLIERKFAKKPERTKELANGQKNHTDRAI